MSKTGFVIFFTFSAVSSKVSVSVKMHVQNHVEIYLLFNFLLVNVPQVNKNVPNVGSHRFIFPENVRRQFPVLNPIIVRLITDNIEGFPKCCMNTQAHSQSLCVNKH